MHKLFRTALGGALALSTMAAMMPTPTAFAEDVPPSPTSSEDEVVDPLPQTSFPTPFFFLIVRWGNVIGEAETKEAVDMNGSVTLSSGRLELARTLLFEPHEDAVSEVSDLNVAWRSRIHGHWDGVMLRASAPQSATATITIGSTTVTKPVSDLVRLKRDVTDLGSGRELVINVMALREPAVVLQAFWGRVGHRRAVFGPNSLEAKPLSSLAGDIETPMMEDPADDDDDAVEEQELDATESIPPPATLSVNFSGDFTVSGGTITRAKSIAFEESDVLNAPSGGTLSWSSTIDGTVLLEERPICAILREEGIAIPETISCSIMRFDRDGFLMFARMNALSETTQFTIRFTDASLNFTKAFTLKDLWHHKFLFEPVKVNGQNIGLGLVLQLHVLRDGRLVRGKGRSEVFRIEKGLKRHIVSPEALVLNGHDWDEVNEVEPEEVDATPEGDPIDLPEGTAVKGRGPAVFVATDGGLCPVASPQAFEAVGLRWDQIVTLPDETINAKPKCKVIDGQEDLVDGLLVRPSGQPTVFRIDNGARIRIPSPEVFTANGYRWNRVKEIPPSIIERFPESGVLGFPDGMLIRGSGPRVFVTEQGKRRPFLDADDFTDAGFRWRKIQTVSDQSLLGVPQGPSVMQ